MDYLFKKMNYLYEKILKYKEKRDAGEDISFFSFKNVAKFLVLNPNKRFLVV